METQTTFLIAILSTCLLLDRRALQGLVSLFWFPYRVWLKGLVRALFLLSKVQFCRSRWETGYLYKLYLKAVLRLLKMKEVEEAMKGIRTDKPVEYVCKCDRDLPKDSQTIFVVKLLTPEEQAKHRDQMYSVKGIGAQRKEQFLTGTVSLDALRMGLKGWKNFKFEDGEEIQFKDENLACIPSTQRDELANYIRGAEEEI